MSAAARLAIAKQQQERIAYQQRSYNNDVGAIRGGGSMTSTGANNQIDGGVHMAADIAAQQQQLLVNAAQSVIQRYVSYFDVFVGDNKEFIIDCGDFTHIVCEQLFNFYC
jgi:hypothetical protein